MIDSLFQEMISDFENVHRSLESTYDRWLRFAPKFKDTLTPEQQATLLETLDQLPALCLRLADDKKGI